MANKRRPGYNALNTNNHLSGGGVPVIGGQPQQQGIVVEGEDGRKIMMPLVAAGMLSNEVIDVIAKVVTHVVRTELDAFHNPEPVTPGAEPTPAPAQDTRPELEAAMPGDTPNG